MLPLATSVLLDTLKILMIGNSLTYYNQMPMSFKHLLEEDGITVSIDTIFMPGSNIECLFIKTFYPELEICSDEIIEKTKVWNRGNAEYGAFVKLVSGYDIVYLQGNELNDPNIYEIINSIDAILEKKGYIIIFQNYKNITWNENVRRKELDKELHYFKEHNQSKRVAILPIGDVFDEMMNMDSSAQLLDNSNHPTQIGSNIIAQKLNELVIYYLN